MTAAPAHFPYRHRAMDGSDASHLIAKYERCQARFNAGDPNWREPVKPTPIGQRA